MRPQKMPSTQEVPRPSSDAWEQVRFASPGKDFDVAAVKLSKPYGAIANQIRLPSAGVCAE